MFSIDIQKNYVRAPGERSYYLLWERRVEAVCIAKDIVDMMTQNISSAAERVDKNKKCTTNQRQETGFIVKVFTDLLHWVAKSVIDNRYNILQNLNADYESKWTDTKAIAMYELDSLKFTIPYGDLTKHVDCMVELVERVHNMKAILNDILTTDILVTSLSLHRYLTGQQSKSLRSLIAPEQSLQKTLWKSSKEFVKGSIW